MADLTDIQSYWPEELKEMAFQNMRNQLRVEWLRNQARECADLSDLDVILNQLEAAERERIDFCRTFGLARINYNRARIPEPQDITD